MYRKHNTILACVIILIISISGADKPCLRKVFKNNVIGCVCNATYCDEYSKVKPLQKGQYLHVMSSSDGLRFNKVYGMLDKKKMPPIPYNLFDVIMENDIRLRINRKKRYQTIVGFGGSFTDSFGINLRKLSEPVQRHMIGSYFGEDGLEYNLARVPIGGTDFSNRGYAYNEFPEDDITLSNFSLTIDDFEFKIPFIREAQQMSNNKLFLVATSWSPPIWMKTSRKLYGRSKLFKRYYQTWADYHVRFLEEYDKNGISFWGITTGNEPEYGNFKVEGFPCLGWSTKNQAKWIVENFGPAIRTSKFSHLKIIGLDDCRHILPDYIKAANLTYDVMKYVDGIGIHWYTNEFFPPTVIDDAHSLYPDKIYLATEACIANRPWHIENTDNKSWNRGIIYAREIIDDLNHWMSGWIDWNLALDVNGGPNWRGNFVDAAVIIRPNNNDFVKQPLFYAMGHFSKFIPRGSIRVDVEDMNNSINNVAFLRPDGGIAVVFYNQYNSEKSVLIQEIGKGFVKLRVPPYSIHTLVYW